MKAFISRIHYPVTTLGPGRRVGIWFQGCSIRCAGCVSVDTWAKGKDSGVETNEIISLISPWLSESNGVTVSGGEPFDQPDTLIELLKKIRLNTDKSILVYSGHPLEVILPILEQNNGIIDALITDPYEDATSQTLALRGSDNQRLHYLTELGKEQFEVYNRVIDDSEKTFDIMFDDRSIWMAGIPRRDDMRRLSELLGNEGHEIVITQDKRPERRG